MVRRLKLRIAKSGRRRSLRGSTVRIILIKERIQYCVGHDRAIVHSSSTHGFGQPQMASGAFVSSPISEKDQTS